MFKNGQGVEQDFKKAMEWYLKAANQGSIIACYNIGTCFLFYCVEYDYLYVGFLYNSGRGVTQDYKKAMEWYLKAGEHVSAQFNIGRFFCLSSMFCSEYLWCFMLYNVHLVCCYYLCRVFI